NDVHFRKFRTPLIILLMSNSSIEASEFKNYIEKNKDRFIQELFELLRIPSVSTDRKFKEDVLRAAAFLKEKLEIAGADAVEVCQTAGHPIVYAEKIIDQKLPTVLVYGHYDVQP